MTKILNASEMGKKGGENRAKNLTKERRSEIARMGGLKRWAAKESDKESAMRLESGIKVIHT